MIQRYIVVVVCAVIANAQESSSQNIITQVTIDTLNTGVLKWAQRHPDALKGGAIRINLPSFDFYTADGTSVYHGEDAKKNALFIRALPGNVIGAKAASLRPTLKEAIEMIPELQNREQKLLTSGKYTAFAFTYQDWDFCKPQNDALEALRKRSSQSGIRVVEVRLQR